jgi:CRP-like cAMP-binding protein
LDVVLTRLSGFQNTLLKALSPKTIAGLRLVAVPFPAERKIEEPGERIRYVYFLESGMASMTTTFSDGAEVEVCMFGYESMIGASALMGSNISLNHVYTQIEGNGYRCDVADAQAEFNRYGLFTKLVMAYVQAQLVQAMQSAGCASRHNFEQRLSRWLLISADRAHVEHFKMSQEFLSHMLGSTRPTVSVVAATLKKEGLISYTRGDITILDRKRLEKRACECYQVIKTFLAEYESAETAHMA